MPQADTDKDTGNDPRNMSTEKTGASEATPSKQAPSKVLRPGAQALFQDYGRPGRSSWGLSPSGALDRQSMRAANLLLGNPAGATVVEILMGGFAAVFERDVEVAVTGAYGPIHIGSEAAAPGRVLAVPAGTIIEIGYAETGLRFYLAVSGGFHPEAFAGSRSHDTLAVMGPKPLAADDALPLMLVAPSAETVREDTSVGMQQGTVGVLRKSPHEGKTLAVRISPGPRLDWFSLGSWQRLTSQEWEVSAESNRIGLRLLGQPLTFARDGQLPSEGTVTGSLQVPPSGLPTVFLADRPVTGGYPVIAVILKADIDQLAQLRPGQRLRFLGPDPALT